MIGASKFRYVVLCAFVVGTFASGQPTVAPGGKAQAVTVRDATIHQQVAAMINGADLVTLSWREDASAMGWKTERARYEGPEGVAQLLSHLEFTSDQPERDVEPLPEGVLLVTQSRCACHGTHVLRAFRGETMIAEISIHHATHLRSKQINGGHDAYLTETSAAWLNATIGWDAEVVPAMEAAMKRQAASSANNRDGG